ncbi:MAG: L,D-transpeptidase [Chthoniobacter sp.]|uniref:L,D-transpeptidase n=1 Tax=Chthoniobacter sp. TaxID=2510640 RepID=UPI0032A1B703
MRRRLCLIFSVAALAADAQQPAARPETIKRVEIDKTKQTLRAYEGDRLILETRISTGKWDKSTPNGQFSAGEKERMHYSKLFHNAPMPYSVQVTGDVFIHGFGVVPRSPASHGCIRVPLDKGNPAKQFFDWVETGTPIEITGHWEGR